nr:PDZ domain-containing protein [Candidatus Sumerlaeota bacterium]
LLSCFIFFAFVAGVSSEPKPLTEDTFIEVSDLTLPAVVSIEVKKSVETPMGRGRFKNRNEMRKFFEDRGMNPNEPIFPFFFFNYPDEDAEIEVPASGSGVIIREDGYIVTNYHVIANAKPGNISVKLNDDSTIDGENVEVWGKDTFSDLAVLKIKSDKKLPALEFADSEQVKIGQWVVALGNPLELKGSVSQGIVSAKHRVIGKAVIEDLLQTTAAINPGNSGGPLVNLDGKIVGINNAIASNTGLWQGVGFAIPSNTVKTVCESIIDTRNPSRGWLGIHMSDVTPSILNYYGLKDVQGVVVAKVLKDSPAEKAGLKPYDIVTKVDGKKVTTRLELLQQIAPKKPGSEIKIEIYREKNKKAKQMTLKVVLGERPSEEELNENPADTKEPAEKESVFEDMGLRLKEKDANSKEPGLEIEEVQKDSPAAKAGIKAGDWILELNRMKVNSLDEFHSVLAEIKDEKNILVMFSRGNEIMFSTIEK